MTRKSSGTNGSVSAVPPKPMSLREWGHSLDGRILDKGWSQADLHRASGLSKDTISKWVAGKVAPNPYNLSRAATAFGITVEELYPHYIENVENDSLHSRSGVEFNSSDLKTGLLTIECRVTVETAQQIMDLLKADAVNRE